MVFTSGANAPKLVELIYFSVISDATYQAEEGMTFAEWCDSSYNTGGFYIDADNLVTNGEGDRLVTPDYTFFPKSETVIIDGTSYMLIKSM